MGFARAVLEYGQYRRVLLFCLGISMVFYLTPALLQWLLFRSVGVSLSFAEVFWVVQVIQLVALLPVSFNAIGLAEGATVLFFSQLGVVPAEAFAVALLARLAGLVVSAMGGILWLLERPKLPEVVNG